MHFISQASISDFCGLITKIVFDALAATPHIHFKHSQVAALLYEVAIVRADDDDRSYDESIKKYGFSAFLKAFPFKEELERYLSFRTAYLPLLLTVIKDNIIKDDDDDDENDNLETARNIIHLAVSLMNEKAEIRDDMTGLDQYLHISTSAGDVAGTGIQAGWSTLLQRAAEAETTRVMQPSSRTESQWNQQEQTIFMSHRTKPAAEVRKLAKALPEFAGQVLTTITKDILAKGIAKSQITKMKAEEAETMRQIDAELSSNIASEIKNLNKDTADELDDPLDPLRGTPYRTLSTCVSNVCSPSGYSQATQMDILDKCQILTTHIQRKVDVGLDMLLIKTVTDKALKGLAALNASAEAKPLRLFLRGTVSPSCGPMALTAAVVLPNVAELTVNGMSVALSLCMTKDQAFASAWSGSRFCPALLAKVPKDGKGKGKGKGKKAKAAPESEPGAQSVTLTLESEDELITICDSTVTLKVYSLTGEVAAVAAGQDIADIRTVVGPSLKRERDAASDDASTAKRIKASSLLGASSRLVAPTAPLPADAASPNAKDAN